MGEVLHNTVNECVINIKLLILTKMWVNEAYKMIWLGKHAFFVFTIRNVVKKGDVLWPLRGPGSVVSIVTAYGLEGLGF